MLVERVITPQEDTWNLASSGEIIQFPTRKESKTQKWSNTVAFIHEVFQVPNLTKKPMFAKDGWRNSLTIVDVYVRIPSLTFADIGRIEGHNMSSVKKLFQRTIKALWDYKASEEIKARYPFDSLGFAKPDMPLTQSTKEKISLSKGGRSLRVKELLLEGRSLEEIKQELGFSRSKFAGACRVVRSWGVNMPSVTPQKTA